jgi:hypothetical protein
MICQITLKMVTNSLPLPPQITEKRRKKGRNERILTKSADLWLNFGREIGAGLVPFLKTEPCMIFSRTFRELERR